MSSKTLSFLPHHDQLRRLLLLRCVAISAQLITLAVAWKILDLNLAWQPMLVTIATLFIVTLLSAIRLSRPDPVSNLEFFAQLGVDVICLSILLYYAGGSTNPFVSLYLLPLVIAAATLPRRHTWCMAALTLSCYSMLMVWYVPLPVAHQKHDHITIQTLDHAHPHIDESPSSAPAIFPLEDGFNNHVIGMWLGFVISAAVVGYFAAEMARAVRSRDAQLNRIREETLRNERIVALGTQAAGAAHELGTPLATMAVVIGEMRSDCVNPQQHSDLAILDEQVKNCKRILDTLLSNVQENGGIVPPEDFLRSTLDEWQLVRPTAQYHFSVGSPLPSPKLKADPGLRSALLNLLNNAADASPEKMDIQLLWNEELITLEIHDHGTGLSEEAALKAGSAFFTTKHEGRGLGLFLANATIERLGGTVRLFNREGGGVSTVVGLPIAQLI